MKKYGNQRQLVPFSTGSAHKPIE